jgi:hypothetical protein
MEPKAGHHIDTNGRSWGGEKEAGDVRYWVLRFRNEWNEGLATILPASTGCQTAEASRYFLRDAALQG